MTAGNSGRWLIYGANGYTGRLVAREAVRRGMRPRLAGRRLESIEAVGRELDLGGHRPRRRRVERRADGGETAQGVEMLLQHEDSAWRLKQLRLLPEDEARHDGLL